MFGVAGVFAAQYAATGNPFPIQLNGQSVELEGYNINDNTYFKLRDIADVVGGFSVDFQNNTIRLSKDGYVYDDSGAPSQTNEDELLKTYAKENINSITDPVSGAVYTNIKYMLTDVSGDYVNDLLAVGMDKENKIAYIDVYQYINGAVTKTLDGHCQGYQGGYIFPLRYNGKIYIGTFSTSSSTGFLEQLLEYRDNEWQAAYSCYIKYDYESGQIAGYIVNGQSVSEQEYNDFKAVIESDLLTAGDFLPLEEL